MEFRNFLSICRVILSDKISRELDVSAKCDLKLVCLVKFLINVFFFENYFATVAANPIFSCAIISKENVEDGIIAWLCDKANTWDY